MNVVVQEHIALRPYVVFSVASFMVLLGIALQVALRFSTKWDGTSSLHHDSRGRNMDHNLS